MSLPSPAAAVVAIPVCEKRPPGDPGCHPGISLQGRTLNSHQSDATAAVQVDQRQTEAAPGAPVEASLCSPTSGTNRGPSEDVERDT